MYNVLYLIVDGRLNEDAAWAFTKGVPFVKFDGEPIRVIDGEPYKRVYRRLLSGALAKRSESGGAYQYRPEDYFQPPDGWIEGRNARVGDGVWYGWVPVAAENQKARMYSEAFQSAAAGRGGALLDGNYELVGPDSCNNPYQMSEHRLWSHQKLPVERCPVDLAGLQDFLTRNPVEGIVWHCPGSREVVVLRRRDVGLSWPHTEGAERLRVNYVERELIKDLAEAKGIDPSFIDDGLYNYPIDFWDALR